MNRWRQPHGFVHTDRRYSSLAGSRVLPPAPTNKTQGPGIMETMRLRAIQQPGNAGALLDSFIRAAGNLPCDCRELSRARELTPTLEKVALRSLEDGHVWRAFTDDRAMWLWDCEVSLDRSRERGLPVVEVRRYDESGAIEDSGTWVRIQQNSWQRCNE